MNNKPMAIANRNCNYFDLPKVSTRVLTALAVSLSLSVSVNAQTVPQSPTSLPSEDEVSAIIYLPDVGLQQLAPQSIVVAANQPVSDAVGKILQAYNGQNVGITDYQVKINPITHQATINFIIKDPRGSEVFQSMSSANQYALFESIRRSLLSQSLYNIDQVNFTANGEFFEI